MDPSQVDRLAETVGRLHQEQGAGAAQSIESFLEADLGTLPVEERIAVVEALSERFRPKGPSPAADVKDEAVFSRICSLLLGRDVSTADLSSSELLERLGESLNTIFDALNQLVGVINETLTGGPTGQETIRQVIGGHLAGEDQTASLESYLGQIREAFLVTQRAFKEAAYHQLQSILSELDPAAIADAGSGGLKFGALRKADFFDTYEQRFEKVKQWFESGRFMEALLREFEKNAQRLSIRENPYQGGGK